MKNTSLTGPGVFKYVLGSYPWLSQSVEDEEEDEISSFSTCWTADCAASYVSSEILSKFTRGVLAYFINLLCIAAGLLHFVYLCLD